MRDPDIRSCIFLRIHVIINNHLRNLKIEFNNCFPTKNSLTTLERALWTRDSNLVMLHVIYDCLLLRKILPLSGVVSRRLRKCLDRRDVLVDICRNVTTYIKQILRFYRFIQQILNDLWQRSDKNLPWQLLNLTLFHIR